MSRILLTGATGFIGSAVLRLAVAGGHEVAALVRPGGEVPAGAARLTGSMADPPWEAVEAFAPDTLIHCAWIATPGLYLESPENEDHARWSLALAQGLARRGLRRLVVLGTCIEYRLPGADHLHETESPLGPGTPYARAKDQLRRRLEELSTRHPGLRLAWGRVFYPYGEGEHPARLCSSLIRTLRRGEEVVLKTPDSTKDYIHIDDLAAAILRVSEMGFVGPVNLGTGAGVTIRAIAEAISDRLGRRDRIRIQEPPAADPFPRVVADAGRLRGLGWEPKVALESGLLRLIETRAS